MIEKARDAEPVNHRLAVGPTGALRLLPGREEHAAGARLPPRCLRAFEGGPGAGLLHLGAVEVDTPLPPSFAFFREVGRLFMAGVCGLSDLDERRDEVAVPAPEAELERLVHAAPPLLGAEYLDAAALTHLWSEVEEAFAEALAEHDGSAQELLRSWSPTWNLVGRVCLHLAENRRDERFPFAFLATQATRLSGHGKVQHQPLAKIMAQSSAAGDRERLLSLLVPVRRAAEESDLVAELLEDRSLFRPQRWTAGQAHRFLEEVPRLEAAGLVVRVPGWWNTAAPPRPRARVSVGGSDVPSRLGAGSVMDFDLTVALDGEPLTDAELEELLSSGEGLVKLRGAWVEVDGEKLQGVLDRWREVREAMDDEGLGFFEAARLLAGARLDDDEDLELTGDDGWSEVVAGEWLREAIAGLTDPSALGEPLPDGDSLLATLRPYQEVGARWLWFLHTLGLGGCLADDMGLGKTLQVLTLLLMLRRVPDRRPSLLVVPTSLLANWQMEIERFAPTLSAVILHPSAAPRDALAPFAEEDASDVEVGLEGVEAAITTYGMLRRLPGLSQVGWQVVVLDEAQAIKNPGSKQARAAKRLGGAIRLALTGTPVENRLTDLWSIFDFLNPGLLGSAKEFGELTQRLARGRRGAPLPDYGPLRSLIRPFILRRLKTDRRVIDDLPDKTEVVAYCGLARRQAALYAEVVAELEQALDEARHDPSGDMARRGLVLSSLMALKQICNHPSQWSGDEGFAPAESGKLARLAEICEAIAARQERVLVFTQFKAMTGPLAAFLAEVFGVPGLVLHGGTTVKRRKELVGSFQADDGPPFFVVSLKAGGTGLNLTAANHVIHFDRWWNPAVERQATDRAFRIGQKRNVLVHKFVCRGTVEERIDELIASKEALSDGVLGVDDGSEVKLTELADEELLKMVRLDAPHPSEEGD